LTDQAPSAGGPKNPEELPVRHWRLAAIYRRFKPGQSLADDFKSRFGQLLDEDTLNQSHQIVIVVAQLDDSSA